MTTQTDRTPEATGVWDQPGHDYMSEAMDVLDDDERARWQREFDTAWDGRNVRVGVSEIVDKVYRAAHEAHRAVEPSPEAGQGLAEYALIVGVIAVGAIVALGVLGGAITAQLQAIGLAL